LNETYGCPLGRLQRHLAKQLSGHVNRIARARICAKHFCSIVATPLAVADYVEAALGDPEAGL
jgi:hypothetical protein